MELMIAIAVVMVAVLPLLQGVVNSHNNVVRHRTKLAGIMQGQSLLEEIKAEKWDESTTEGTTYTTTRSNIGRDDGEAEGAAADFDDVDDYHNYEHQTTLGYTRKVQVTYVNADLNGGVEAAGAGVKTDYKLVEVTVTWKINDETKTEKVSSVCANGF